jgi:hypothetical protein
MLEEILKSNKQMPNKQRTTNEKRKTKNHKRAAIDSVVVGWFCVGWCFTRLLAPYDEAEAIGGHCIVLDGA